MKRSGHLSKLDIFQGDCGLVNYDQNTGSLREETMAHASSHLKHPALVCMVNGEISENMATGTKPRDIPNVKPSKLSERGTI